MRVPSAIAKPAANVLIVSGVMLALKDHVSDAGIRGAIAWCTAAAVVETLAHLVGKRRN